ncbi:MAG: 5'-methylthioadenosine/S-adenosylhomocysteine nucleosidase [Desulfobacterales bacterium]
MKTPPPTTLIVATLFEAKPFIRQLELKEHKESPFPVFFNQSIFLTVTGIGKVNAAMGTAYCCTAFNPSQIMNIGAAGASDNLSKPGEVFQISKIYELDRLSFRTRKPLVHKPDLLEGFPSATLATQDRPILDPADRRRVSQTAQLVDMEGAAVVQVCRRFGTVCRVFKFVSDTPNHTSVLEVIANIKRYRKRFCDYICERVLKVNGEQ